MRQKYIFNVNFLLHTYIYLFIQESKQSNALNLVNVAGIFYILIGGLALAITIAVLEFFIKANIEAKQTKVRERKLEFVFIGRKIFILA